MPNGSKYLDFLNQQLEEIEGLQLLSDTEQLGSGEGSVNSNQEEKTSACSKPIAYLLIFVAAVSAFGWATRSLLSSDEEIEYPPSDLSSFASQPQNDVFTTTRVISAVESVCSSVFQATVAYLYDLMLSSERRRSSMYAIATVVATRPARPQHVATFAASIATPAALSNNNEGSPGAMGSPGYVTAGMVLSCLIGALILFLRRRSIHKAAQMAETRHQQEALMMKTLKMYINEKDAAIFIHDPKVLHDSKLDCFFFWQRLAKASKDEGFDVVQPWFGARDIVYLLSEIPDTQDTEDPTKDPAGKPYGTDLSVATHQLSL